MQSNNLIKIACAGAGKTWDICHEALHTVNGTDFNKRIAIISYTNRGIQAIETEIKNQNYGVLHHRITIKSWYTFLLSELIKPYQTYLFGINEIKSFDFSRTYGYVNKHVVGSKARYMSSNENIISNEASELVIQLNNKSNGEVIHRLEKIYDTIYFDEVQDLAGYDLEIIRLLTSSTIRIICVGDPKQATFTTNTGKKNKNISGKNMEIFFNELVKKDQITMISNLTSRRFNLDICAFANIIYPVKNLMNTSMNIVTGHDGVFMILESDVKNYYAHYNPQILRFDKKTDTMSLSAMNFGECKGLTFDRVMIFPNKTFLGFLVNGKVLGSPEKYYIAATRSRYSLVFVVKKLPKKDNMIDVVISCGNKNINGKKIVF